MSDTQNPIDSIVSVLANAADTYKPTGAVSFGQTRKIAGHDEDQAQLIVEPIFDPESEVLNVDDGFEALSPEERGRIIEDSIGDDVDTRPVTKPAPSFDQDSGPEDFYSPKP